MSKLPCHILRIADLANRKPTHFMLAPDAAARKAVAAHLGITGIKKLTFKGAIAPAGKSDWTLTADLGATVVQDCVVTLAPVNTRIDEPVERQYLAQLPEIDAAEIEMPADDTVDALPEAIDVAGVMIEALSLALPPFPRATDAALGETVITEPGATPLTREAAKPFAGLAALRDQLTDKGADDAEDN